MHSSPAFVLVGIHAGVARRQFLGSVFLIGAGVTRSSYG